MRALIAPLSTLMLFAATPVVAGVLGDRAAAYRAGDYQKTFLFFERLSEQVDALAQQVLLVGLDHIAGTPQWPHRSPDYSGRLLVRLS